MKAIVFPSVFLALLASSAPGLAADSKATAVTTPAAGASVVRGRNWGPRHNGRWIWGWRAPGGWGGYRPAVRGWVLPGYWIAPRYHIGDHARYGWSAPPPGYGWSRYYDDAVLTDRDGVVHETHRNVDWDRYDEYRDGPEFAGEYREAPPRGEHHDGDAAYDGRWSGTWRGSHNGGPEHVYEGSFDGEYRGSLPHWGHRGGPGYGYGEVVTTTTYRPVTTTTTTETEEWVPAP